MALGYSTALREAQLNAVTTAVGGSGFLRIYSGTRPATGGAATTLLAELTLNATFAPSAASNLLTLNAITADTSANATGTASWFRIVTSAGTFVIDGDVATSGSDLNVSTTSFVAGATVSVSSATIAANNP